ncbi:MAG: radical SAM/SPASM domain-containing protein [Pirellulales bacterium]
MSSHQPSPAAANGRGAITIPTLQNAAMSVPVLPFYPAVPPISLELTNRCNLKCPYCANGTLTRPSGTIAWSLLERLIEQCAGGPKQIDWLHGTGEPLLWSRLEDVIRLIRGRDAGAASFATNATLLTADRVESLLAAGLGSIYISLDSLDERIYAATRGGKLETVIGNIRTMLSIVPGDFTVTIALMNHKDQRLTPGDIDRCHEIFGPAPRIKVNVVETGIMPSARADYRLHRQKVATCSLPNEYFFIAHDGRVALCCSDQDVAHPIGDTNVDSIDEIWFKPSNQAIFRSIGLGLRGCPEFCTAQCHLKTPA